MNTADPIRNKVQIKSITDYYSDRGQMRNYALIVMGLHTALRIGDLLAIRWRDVYDEDKAKMMKSISLTEQKTGKTKTIALHSMVVTALEQLYDVLDSPNGERFVFESSRDRSKAISRIQAHRIVKAAAEANELEGTICCHSLRKTFGYHAWKKKIPLAIIMDIYNHSSFSVTRRYLGISQDDKDDAYLGVDFIR